MRFGAMDVVERFSRTVVGRKDWSNEGEPKVLGDCYREELLDELEGLGY